MERLNGYVSDTAAGLANQTWFATDGQPLCGRVYYRLTVGGTRYRLAFSDVTDSTFSDGSHSRANERCGGFLLRSLRVGLCEGTVTDRAESPSVWHTVTFDGKEQVTVDGTSAVSDPVALCAKAGQTLCVEAEVQGARLPCHEELQVASFVRTAHGFTPSKRLPVPWITAVERAATRLTFLGDSITQGIGATPNTDRHVAARVASKLAPSVAVHNLGIGFARASDAATDGVWLQKVKLCEAAVVCLGVNDLLGGAEVDGVLDSLQTVVRRLKNAGVRVLLQSVPPFEFDEETAARWRALNARILQGEVPADAVFDVVPLLCGEDGAPLYGGHPNDEGCAVWAEALLPTLTAFLKNETEASPTARRQR